MEDRMRPAAAMCEVGEACGDRATPLDEQAPGIAISRYGTGCLLQGPGSEWVDCSSRGASHGSVCAA